MPGKPHRKLPCGFGPAFAGFRVLWREPNFRFHLFAALAAIGLGAALRISRAEWLWVVLAIVLVWVTEALNTAVERLGDAISDQHDPRLKAAKDAGAAAVLLASLTALVIGTMIFLPHLLP
ncbi:MAG: diacylglycerol kinase family protein [Opitutales bacterium]